MNIRTTAVAALAMTTLAVPFSALSSVPGLSDVECSLNTAAYRKVMEDAFSHKAHKEHKGDFGAGAFVSSLRTRDVFVKNVDYFVTLCYNL